jgi:hypothetical protein
MNKKHTNIHMGEMGNESNVVTDDPWIEVYFPH